MNKLMLLFLTLYVNFSFSQQKFSTTINDERDLKPFSICEHHDNYYVLSTIHENSTIDTTASCLYKFNRNGILIDSLQYKYNSNNTLITCIEVIDDTLTLIGYSDSETDTIFNMHILRISDSMNIEDVYTYPFNCKHLYFLCTANNSNGLTIGGGHMPVSGDVRDLHFFSFNNHWELTHQKTYDFYPGDGIYGLTSCNDTIYASVHTNSVNNTRDNIWRLETDLEYTIIGQPYNNTRYSTITNDFNNDLILSGMTSEYNGGVSQDYISNFRMSTSGENKENIQYGVSGVRDKSSPYGGISASENRIFCISMEGSGDGIIEWFSPFPVKARLTVMDYNFNELSESYLDDDACYISCKIVVTSDGGCIFIASRYDYQAGNLERDLVVVKTDPNGIFTWTTEISLPDLPNGIYPNPANEYIHIKKQFIPGLLQIFDINGKPILETEAKSTVDISNLVSGNYVYRIVNEKGIVTSAGKMIVE